MPNQTKIILSVALATIGLGTLLFFQQPTGPAEKVAETGLLQLDKQEHDFGTISMKDGKVKANFRITNPTSDNVEISKLYTTCMCTTAILTAGGQTFGPYGMPGHGAFPTFKQNLAPGEAAQVEVIYDPNAHGPAGVGYIERSAILESGGAEVAVITIKANVTP